MTFRVLFVCTGNVCRSPLGERLFAARVDPTLSITVSSAGVHALEGSGGPPGAPPPPWAPPPLAPPPPTWS